MSSLPNQHARFWFIPSGAFLDASALLATTMLCICFWLCLVAPVAVLAQTNQWRWMGGSSNVGCYLCGQPGVYGTQGVYAAGNVPGSRGGAVSWTDASGNLWLFGGGSTNSGGYGDDLNDLWEYNPALGQWRWMGGSSAVNQPGVYGTEGVYAAGNVPGSGFPAGSWTDASGNFWLFGVGGNDLWEYNPALGQWRWMGGSSAVNQPGVYGTEGVYAVGNVPGSRGGAVSWTDASGNLWLFGGAGEYYTFFNDLWEYNPALGQWRWMGGSSTGTQFGVYGTQGVYAAANVPGSRADAVSWTDASGNLWLLGGYGLDSVGDGTDLNDLWEYNPALGQWRWMGGSTKVQQSNGNFGVPGVYGTQGVYAAANFPGGRSATVSWTDASGNVWLFGGRGYDSADIDGDLNDLWEYNPTIEQWRWMGGSSTGTQFGVYGTQGVYAAANVPGSRADAGSWTDASGNLWLFGGNGYDSASIFGYLNDLWEYEPSGALTTYTIGGTVTGLSGTGLVLQNNGGNNLTVSEDGGFTFTNPVASGGAYDVTALTQPSSPAQICEVTNGSGTASANVTNVQVTCTAAYTIGGTVSGLSGTGLVLQNNGDNNLAISSNGSFAFTNPVASGGPYDVTVLKQPSGPAQTCVMTNGSGTASANVTNVLIACVTPSPAINEWRWMGGSSADNQPGVYGTQGVYAAGNVPGSRDSAVSWTDASGNFWFFGGGGYGSSGAAGDLNDLWEYNPALGQWRWMGGGSAADQPGVYGTQDVYAAGSVPGGRDSAVSWTDASGNFWLFGGQGYDSSGTNGYLNDLWEYNPALGQWRWMGGSSILSLQDSHGDYYAPEVFGTEGVYAGGNVPDSRVGAVSWTDASGDFWLFGGQGYDSSGTNGYLNDLWECNPAIGEWRWMGGSSAINQIAVYGTQGVYAAGNAPGSNGFPLSWTDASGNLWLFGGFGYVSGVNNGYLNDLWEYNPTSGQWRWMGGGSADNQPGVYGTQGVYAAGNVPGSRGFAVSWTDASSNLWLFGGFGWNSTTWDYLNDLWEYNPTSAQWRWLGGSSTVPPCGFDCGQAGVYGTQGVYAAGNVPGSREPAVSWKDTSGNLWLFGGWGYDAAGTEGDLNDLWEYEPSVVLATYTVGGTVSGLSGTGLVLQNNGGNNLAISSSGNFAFTTPVASGGAYDVTVLTQPSSPVQTCVVTNSSGTASANVANVQIACIIIPVVTVTCPSPTYDDKPHGCTPSATAGMGGATITGSFSWSPAATETDAGTYTMTATFTPQDQTDYEVGSTGQGNLVIGTLIPGISTWSPAAEPANGAAFTLTVNGANFVPGTTVNWNGTSLVTTVASSTQLTAAITSADLATVGTANVTVTNPAASGGASAGPIKFAIDTATGTAGAVTVSSTSTPITVTPGQSTTAAVSFTGASATAQITATCMNLPSGITCGAYDSSSNSVPITASASAAAGSYQMTIMFTIVQQPAATAAVTHSRGWFAAWCGLLGLPVGLLWIGGRRRKVLRRILVALVGLLLLAVLVGCSGISASPATVTSQSSVAVTLSVQ
jgi:N-acetylneuraminic acid mutarotase